MPSGSTNGSLPPNREARPRNLGSAPPRQGCPPQTRNFSLLVFFECAKGKTLPNKNDPFYFHRNQSNGIEPPLVFRRLPRPDDRQGQPWNEDLTKLKIFRKPPLASGGGFFISTDPDSSGWSTQTKTKTNHEQYNSNSKYLRTDLHGRLP